MRTAWIARFEWRKLTVQRKSLAGFGVVVFINLLFAFAFWLRERHPPRNPHHRQDIPTELLAEVFNAVTYTVSILAPCMFLLFPMTLAVLVAHSLSGDVETGAIRLLLARPVPRWRLLLGKWTALTAYALGMLALLLVTSYLTAGILFKPMGDMVVIGPLVGLSSGVIAHPWPEAFWRLLMAYGFAGGMLAATVAMALMFATLTRHFASAAILTAAVFFCSYTAENLPLLSAIRPYLPTYRLPFWKWALAEQIPWDRLGQDLLWTAAYTVIFLVVGGVAFSRRDF